MFETLDLNRMAHGLAAHSGARLGVIAQNIAHADSPGYKARDITNFSDLIRSAPSDMRHTRAGHLSSAKNATTESYISREESAPNGNSVSIEREMVKAAEARQSHEMALGIYSASSNLLRSALGRN